MGTSPPGPLRCGSTTWRGKPAATAASNALPPCSSTAMPAAEASQCVDATIPNVPRSSGRVVNATTRDYLCRHLRELLVDEAAGLRRGHVQGLAEAEEAGAQRERRRAVGGGAGEGDGVHASVTAEHGGHA